MANKNKWLNDFFNGSLSIKVINRYECPVCKRYHGKTRQEVVDHYMPELNWQKLHKNTQPGDKVKYVINGKIKYIFTVKKLSFGQYGFSCGRIMTITLCEENSYYTASSINRLTPATEEEVAGFAKQALIIEA